MTAPNLKKFEGRWMLERRIQDCRASAKGDFHGEVRFTPIPAGGLLYEEIGTLDYNDQPPMAATRRYIWMQINGGIEVLFEDGRPFHKFMTDRLMPDANHLCEPDLYHVSYDFTGWPVWRSEWRVVGPAKDYRMLSAFHKQD